MPASLIHIRIIRMTACAWPAAVLLLGACSGGNKPPAPQVAQHRELASADLPELGSCLDKIATALSHDPSQRAVGLDCLDGTLRGLTSDGSVCALQVNAQANSFRFDYGRESVSIVWQDVSFPPNRAPIHNLENVSIPSRPGVQLTRFTGGLAPVTEAIVLRSGILGRGAAAMPTMAYQRTASNQTEYVECRFGK